MMKSLKTISNETGFILVWSLLLMIVVTLLGVAGISTSIFERQMASNEALHKQAFYAAEGGTENGLSMLTHNISCISGFVPPNVVDGDYVVDGDIRFDDGSINFWIAHNYSGEIPMPTDVNRHFYYPSTSSGNDPHTNININGKTELMVGANLPMLAGYEGKGKALGQDGAFLEFDIKAKHVGSRNNETGIHIAYRLDNNFAVYPQKNCIYQ